MKKLCITRFNDTTLSENIEWKKKPLKNGGKFFLNVPFISWGVLAYDNT